MKSITPVTPSVPTTLPLHEHNARRRRAKIAPKPSKDNESHNEAKTRPAADAGSLLHTYGQFPPQGALHE